MPKPVITQADYEAAAKLLAVPVAAVKAVASVESKGSGFISDRPKVLFERHIMLKLLREKLGAEKADDLAVTYPDIINKQTGGYLGGLKEHERMDRAANIDRDCALQSASWGMFQIMGFHWRALGYSSLQAFVNAMYQSEGAQLEAFVRFIKADPTLHNYLKARNWAGFARRYNGPDYAKNEYDKKMSDAYKREAS